MATSYLQLSAYVEVPYDKEYIVALSSNGSVQGELSPTVSLMWDISAVSKNTSKSLSGAEFCSYGKMLDYNVLTVPAIHTAYQPIAGSITVSSANIPALSSYCGTTFDFISGGQLVMSLSGDYSTICQLKNKPLYASAVGTLDRSTGAFTITPIISLSSAVLSATYIGGYGTYSNGSTVNAATQNILGIDIQNTAFMYRVSGVLDTGVITNPVPNLSALQYFPIYTNNASPRINYFNNKPEFREFGIEVVNYVGSEEGPFPPWGNVYWQIVKDSNIIVRDLAETVYYPISSYYTVPSNTFYPTGTLSGIIVDNLDIRPSTVTFDVSAGAYKFADNGANIETTGSLTSVNPLVSGTIVYRTGAWTLDFSKVQPVTIGTPITAIHFPNKRDHSNQWGWKKDYLFKTPTFNSLTQTPSDHTITIKMTYMDSYYSVTNPVSTYTFTIDDFPNEDSFRFRALVANNDPFSVGIDNGDGSYSQKLWRDKTQTTVAASALFQIPGWDSTQGTIGINWGDGHISGFPTLASSISHTYSVPPLTTVRVFTFADGVSAQNWLSAHSKTDISGYMDIEFVDRFLSGNFIAFPEYYFDNTGTYYLLNASNYTQSQGVCAYGEGSEVVINLSAAEPDTGDTLYQWGITYVDNLSGGAFYNDVIPTSAGDRVDSYSFGDTYSYTQGGSALSLSVFNSTFPVDMNPWYINDAGQRVKYPNFDNWLYAHTVSSDNSNVLFQNVRVFEYEEPTFALSDILQESTRTGITLTSNLSVMYPSYSPVETLDNQFVWTLSALNWSGPIQQTSTSNLFSYTLTEGSGILPGTLRKNETVPLTLSVSALISFGINERDFEPRLESTVVGPVTASVVAEFEPVLRIFTNDLHSITGETIYFQNITEVATSGNAVSAYMWNVGDGSGYITVSGTDTSLISATYANAGTYSVSLTSFSENGIITTREFTDIITVEPYYQEYDDEILRVYGSSGIKYPYEFVDIKVKPNEWATADNINSAFDKLNEDLEYLRTVMRKYLEPPTKLYGWLGQSKYNETDINWHVTIPGINGQYSSTENVVDNDRGLNDIRAISVYNDNLYTATKTMLYILSSDYNATEISSRSIKTIGDPFFDIAAMRVNSSGQIYVLDAAVQKIVVFDNYENSGWKFLYSWGKYGGANTFKGFSNPVDMHIDSSDNVWITDSGNNVIKKYTKTGSWLATFSSDKFSNLISMTTDVDDNIHVLMGNGILKLNSSGEYITTYNIVPSGQAPRRIISGRDGFLYVICKESILKVNTQGVYGGIFANTLKNINLHSAYHDENRNLYVTNYNSIIKYYEKITIDSVSVDTGIDLWSMDDIYIHKDEYVQDWVYNKSLSRLWDNIEIVRRGIIGVIYEITDSQRNIKNIIAGFTPAQYEALFGLKKKEEIFIGINEIVTADSLNRCLKMLFEILDLLLKIVSGEYGRETGGDGDNIDIPVGPVRAFGWRWTDVASWGMNPFTWEQVSTRGFYPTRWECAITGKICDE